MTRTLASLINVAGVAMVVAGLLMQRRALARFGRSDDRRPRWRPVWETAIQFRDPAGARMYLRGDAVFSWGMMVVCAMVGYIIGHW